MKRIIKTMSVVLIILAMLFSLCGCTLVDNAKEFASDKFGISFDKDSDEDEDEDEDSRDDEKEKKKEKKDKKKKSKKDKEETPAPEPTEEPDAVAVEVEESFVDVFGDYSITFPGYWNNKYYSEEVHNDNYDGFYFYQKASYDKEEGMGFLFSIYTSEEMIPNYAGDSLIAYDDDYFYYMGTPTDVPCDLEDEKIYDEYFKMSEAISEKMLVICVENPYTMYNVDEYVLPLSDKKTVSEDYLYSLDVNQLWIARNEIYARHGRAFETWYLQNHFDMCSWYENLDANVADSDLNDIEIENIKKIQAEEATRTSDYPKKLSYNKEYKEDLDGDGKNDTFSAKASMDSFTVTVNGTQYTSDSFDLYPDMMVTDRYYVTQINSWDPELQIMFLDEGPSCDQVSYYFTLSESKLIYIGYVEGFATKEDMGFNPYTGYGDIKSSCRTELMGTGYYYGVHYYNQFDHLITEPYGNTLYEYTSAFSHTALTDFKVYSAQSEDAHVYTIPSGESVIIVATDGKEWVKLKTASGDVGYVKVGADDVMEPSGMAAIDALSEILYVD